MERRFNVIPLELLTDDSTEQIDGAGTAPSRLLDEADLIYAVNSQDNRDILVFGKEKLRRITESDVPEGARVIRVRIGSRSQDFEQLLEIVQERKGRHDYAESA